MSYRIVELSYRNVQVQSLTRPYFATVKLIHAWWFVDFYLIDISGTGRLVEKGVWEFETREDALIAACQRMKKLAYRRF